MTWRLKEPHQQPWYWPSSARIQSPHIKGEWHIIELYCNTNEKNHQNTVMFSCRGIVDILVEFISRLELEIRKSRASICWTNGCWLLPFFLRWENKVECCYNVVHYSMILHTSLQWLRQSINHSLNPQNTSHIARPNGQAKGCILWGFGRKLIAF